MRRKKVVRNFCETEKTLSQKGAIIHMKPKNKFIFSLIVMAASVFMFLPTVHADTDGSEIQITDQPDRLILQFGPQWAGVEFVLKTDAGVYPVPVVVDASGILKMDLGGSKTYTLSSIGSAIAVPSPQAEMETPAPPEPSTAAREDAPVPENQDYDGIPTSHIIMFSGGLAIAVTSLLLMRDFKRRRDQYEYSEDDDFDTDPPD